MLVDGSKLGRSFCQLRHAGGNVNTLDLAQPLPLSGLLSWRTCLYAQS